MRFGYLVATAVFALVFAIVVMAQVKVDRFHPALYWATIVAATRVGTTLADFADRSLRIGYAGGASLLLALLAVSLFVWYRATGSVGVENVRSRRSEVFYWTTILLSQTLGTALGDWVADSAGLGYEGAALLFGAMLCLIAAGYSWMRMSRTALFWIAS